MIALLSAVIPSTAADAAHDAAHETAARFRHGTYSVACPTCHVPAGVLCLARRSIHAARRDRYLQNPKPTGLVPLLVGRAR
ncbi:zinc finger domain-containing protein [Streptomyces xantholiticus]|uniref:DNA-binding phage zinc finger domain-containing protein n=1 Tax=Streptomyces xantholiticus TaxID=68285 RepID=A0ABV1UZT1_9ACTN